MMALKYTTSRSWTVSPNRSLEQRTQRIYSDEFIRIEQPDRIITGHGFESNQQMTVYTIRKPEGIFYVDEEAAAADSLQTDTIN